MKKKTAPLPAQKKTIRNIFSWGVALDSDNRIYHIVGLLGILNVPVSTYVI